MSGRGLSARTPSSDKMVVRSFRLSEDAFAKLVRDAKERDVSVNTAVNELLIDYVENFLPMSQLKPLYLPASLVKLFSEAIPEDKIDEIAKKHANDPIQRGFFIESRGEFTSDVVLDFMRSSSQHDYFTNSVHGSKSSIIILVHNVARNWSLYLASYWKELLRLAGLPDVKTFVDDNAAIFEFEQSRQQNSEGLAPTPTSTL